MILYSNLFAAVAINKQIPRRVAKNHTTQTEFFFTAMHPRTLLLFPNLFKCCATMNKFLPLVEYPFAIHMGHYNNNITRYE